MTELQQMLEALKRPEYVHVLLNPLPIYGMVMALAALVLGLIVGNKGAQMLALLLILFASVSVWPVSEYGEKAAERVGATVDGEGLRWLRQHEHRAEVGAWAYYTTGLLALVTFVVKWKLPKAERWMMALVLVAVLVSLSLGGWIAHAGGQVRHTEFRTGPPPTTRAP